MHRKGPEQGHGEAAGAGVQCGGQGRLDLVGLLASRWGVRPPYYRNTIVGLLSCSMFVGVSGSPEYKAPSLAVLTPS
jgi:hypothetical protein